MEGVPHSLRSAKWIWSINHHWDLHNCYVLFRKSFVTSSKSARLHITADQSYQIYVNEEYVCRGPARGFQENWPFDTIDLAKYLRKGKNTLAVRAHNPGFSNFQYITKSFAGLLAALELDDLVVVTDETWKCRRQAGVHRDTVPASLQLFPQEHIDLRIEDPCWMTVGFDDAEWIEPTVTLPWNSRPWKGLEPRGMPMLEEKLIEVDTCIAIAGGVSHASYLTARDVCKLRFDEGMKMGPAPDSEIDSPLRADIGNFQSRVYDFGRTVVGSLVLEIHEARGGEIVDAFHFERLDPTTLEAIYVPDSHSRVALGSRLVCRAGRQQHQFFHAFGFRYVIITVRDAPGGIRVKPRLRTTLYPLAAEGSFLSSEKDLNRIWSACAWTQRCCSLDAFVDTPWREQAQWWGDARIQAKNVFFLSNDTALLERGIAQIASQTTDKLTFGHAPTMAQGCVLPDFTLIWILTIWDHYWQTGRLDLFLKHKEGIFGALSYFKNHLNKEFGLVAYDERFWLFLDWEDLFKQGYSSTYNLWILLAVERVIDLCELADRKSADVESLRIFASRIRRGLECCIDERGLLREGRSFSGSFETQVTTHAQTLAILASLRPELNDLRIQEVLLPSMAGRGGTIVPASCYWINYVFEVLTRAGRKDQVIESIQSSWKAMAEHGTTWEVFSPKPGEESFSHAWSAHPLYHLMQIIGGVTQAAPAWKVVDYEPLLVGTSAEVRYPTPNGVILSRWARMAEGTRYVLSVPEGVIARIRIPGAECEHMGTGQPWTAFIESAHTKPEE
jgi:alpha-L-rhamnosidase